MSIIWKIKIALKVINVVNNWPLYFKNYFWPSDLPFLLDLKNGFFLFIRSGAVDITTFNAIWLNDIYTPSGFKINKGDVVLDIGAHSGIFSIFAAIKGAIVYSFEPAPDNIVFLKRNIDLNKKVSIEFFDCAIAAENGEKEMSFYPESLTSYAFSSVAEKRGEKIMVQTITLDNFIKDKNIQAVDFLKMNCEGAEYEIFFNCPVELFKIIKKISVQCHDLDEARNRESMKSFLEKNGFTVKASFKKYNILYAKRK